MNPLYKLPLHGVSCGHFGDLGENSHNTPYKLTMCHHSLVDDEFVNTSSVKPIWMLSDIAKRYTTEISLYNAIKSNGYILQVDCQGKGQFHFSENTCNVLWNNEGTDSAHYFQTIGLALWLELKGILCIHANAISYNNSAFALMAPSRTGKTTLTTYLCQNGFQAMTDDMIAIYPDVNNQYKVYPSWPVSRLWPDTLAMLFEQEELPDNTERVHKRFDKKSVNLHNNNLSFCTSFQKLNTIYLLNRVEQKNNESSLKNSNVCNITTLSSSKAVILLLQNSVLGNAFSALNIEHKRVLALSKLVSNIQVKMITYVSGQEYLPNISKEIIKDLAN